MRAKAIAVTAALAVAVAAGGTAFGMTLAGGSAPAGTADPAACEAYLAGLWKLSQSPGYVPPATRPPDPPACQGLSPAVLRELVAQALSG
jgi:hypothetical protein